MALSTPLHQPNVEVQQANTPDEPQFNILNTTIFPTETVGLDQSQSRLTEFHEFSRFPTEIQLRILELIPSPNTKRLLTIHLHEDPRIDEESRSSSPQRSLYTESNDLGNVISGFRYRVTLPHPPIGSILLQICHKSRELALRRYRIRLPMNPGNPYNNEYLYIDPEKDALYLDSFHVLPSTLAAFLHDLRAYDDQRSGLCNLAINTQFDDNLGLLHSATPDFLQPAEVESFKQSLMALEHLWFIHLLDNDNRYTSPPPTQPFTGLSSFSVFKRPVAHAVPLFAEASEFHLMPADPRQLKPSDFELVRFSKYCSPKAGCLQWERMENALGMTAENGSLPQREISYVIAVDATANHSVCSHREHSQCREHSVRSISSLETYLAREGHKELYQVGGLNETEKPQEVSVAGFWVFPVDVLDGQEPHHAGVHSDMDVVDFSNRSPALGF
ncbi:unnamed protein product [Clonostachys solani]|uniref:2EXR domain-containing protein n=1 Tax=Clonostachys solani TaxID=160281 RepID=A0A9N9W774_9HYPO|nr:unnamed protein product [Clonostachys solani]